MAGVKPVPDAGATARDTDTAHTRGPFLSKLWGSRRGQEWRSPRLDSPPLYQRPPLVETLSAGPRLPAWSTAWIVKEVTPAGTVIDCFDPAGAVAGMVWLEKLTL